MRHFEGLFYHDVYPYQDIGVLSGKVGFCDGASDSSGLQGLVIGTVARHWLKESTAESDFHCFAGAQIREQSILAS
jgi:hypothetical protein